jgi:hypothetical protein
MNVSVGERGTDERRQNKSSFRHLEMQIVAVKNNDFFFHSRTVQQLLGIISFSFTN